MPQVYRSLADRPPARRSRPPFDTQAVLRHRENLVAILKGLDAALANCEQALSPQQLQENILRPLLRRYPRDGCGFFSRSELLAGFRLFAEDAQIGLDEGSFTQLIQMRPTRTQSGVVPVTVFTPPFPCPGQCIFCPNDLRMPKSYLSDEPGAQRAEDNGFHPYLQTWNRLAVFRALGHSTQKVELIVLGGTWSFYPRPYQRWFVGQCLLAMNDFGAGIDGRQKPLPLDYKTSSLPRFVDGRDLSESYNKRLSRHLKQHQHLSDDLMHATERPLGWDTLRELQRDNAQAACRCVGLVLETRPDYVSEDEVRHLRRLGCTKVQLGIQSLNEEVLRRNKRGHTATQSRQACDLLRRAGFKIMAHWMPNLLGSSVIRDGEDFQRLFDSRQGVCPDELKVYPCSLIESAELMQFYERGEWQPYARDELLALLMIVFRSTPRYCRLSRVIRDIPSDDIVAGNRTTNLRELAERQLHAQGQRSQDIRRREIKKECPDVDSLHLHKTHYATATGEDVFLEYVDDDDQLAALLRLSLPSEASFIAELASHALIREVHVYGPAMAVGERQTTRVQHQGLGRALVEAAQQHARAEGYAALCVISAVGTRQYYRNLGFVDGELYQHYDLHAQSADD